MAASGGAPEPQAAVPASPETSELTACTSAPRADYSKALAEISRSYHAALVRFLAVRTGSVEDAKEIVQEAYAKVLELDRSGTISALADYIWRIAVNLAVDRKRQHALRERHKRTMQSVVERGGCSAESVADARERLAIVERAIDELPARCQEAFALHVLRGLRFDEVGREMGISDRMARKHVARALEYLQSCLTAIDAERRAP